MFTGSWGNCKLYDPNKKELKFELNPDKSGISLESKAFHYDLKSDTLFIYDYDSNIHCILHPSMDQGQNRKNYRSPEQTLKMIENKEFGSHIELYKNKYLIIDGTITPWNTVWHGDYRYQVVDGYKVSLWNGSSSEINFEKKADEIVESTAIHPCGDVYRLVYNKKTNLHTLYCVENTWDTKWRKQWFKTHK